MRIAIDLNLLLSERQQYNAIVNYTKGQILKDFSKRHDKITLVVSGQNFEMTLGKALLNFLLLASFVESPVEVTPDLLYLKDSVSQGDFEKQFNKIIDVYRKSDVEINYDHIRVSIAETLNEMSDISGYLNVAAGNSISFQDFVRLSVEDKEIHDLFYHKIRYGLQYSEIEKEFAECGNKLMDYFKRRPDSDLYPFVVSGTGINGKQLTQCISFVGLKPDLDGSVIPVAINDNYLVGLSNLENYYINCKGTRKALYTNHKMTRKSGYLTRKLSLCNIDNWTDNTLLDCGTEHYIHFEVTDEKKLKQIIGRHYYDLNDAFEKVSELKTVTETSYEIIGKTIGLRSPVTCAGKHVCTTCYGRELAEINKDVNTGLIAVLRLTEPLTQAPLSAKHLLTTKTTEIKWGDDFKNYMLVNMNNIYLRKDVEFEIEFDNPGLEAYDEDEEKFTINEFRIIPESGKTIEFKSPTPLFIRRNFLNLQTAETVIRISSDPGGDVKVFSFNAANSELTKSLQEVLDLIETSSHLGVTNYHEMVNKFSSLLISNNLGYIRGVHAEMICRPLIVDAYSGKRLDFSMKSLNSYRINRVSKSIMDGPLSVSLAFERLNDQFVNLQTYEKSEESYMDYLFR